MARWDARCLLPVQKNSTYFQNRRKELHGRCPCTCLQDNIFSRKNKSWKGLSFRLMALNGGLAGGGPLEMAEHTSKCRSDPCQAAGEELNRQTSCPKG